MRTSARTGNDAASEAARGFADLLGAPPARPEPTPPRDTAATSASNNDPQREPPDPIAAPIDAMVPPQDQRDLHAAFAEVATDLADLKASLAAGTPLDPEALARIDAALQALAGELGIDLNAFPAMADLKTLAQADLPPDASLQSQLSKALAPLAQALLAGDDNPELPPLARDLGQKLAALSQALAAQPVDGEALAALGLSGDGSADDALQAALARLLATPAPLKAEAATRPLAAPSLKLEEPALGGKAPGDAARPLLASAEPPRPEAEGPPASRPKAEPVPAAAPAAAAETEADPQLAGQTTQQVSRIDAAAAPRAVQVGYQTSQQQLNLPQLAFEMVRQVTQGNTRFQMRLDPAELGRIDVKLDIDNSGRVHARLMVEKSETLDLMQRDQRALERALQQAGLDQSKTTLEFSLRQNSSGAGQNGANEQGRDNSFARELGLEDETPPPVVNLYRASLSASGVNIIA